MELKSIGYIGIVSERVDEWTQLATELLGMQVVKESQRCIALRMDELQQRLMIEAEGGEGCRYFGWEVADADAMERMASRIETAGVRVTLGSSALADRRRVKGLIVFEDPVGNCLEIFYGAASADTPFVASRNISGFRTGALGLGHVVLTCRNIEQLMPFYCNVLGFHLSDYTLRPFKAYFFHINARHHSFALVETGTNGVHHVMVELFSLDDVGQGYDVALTDPRQIGVTLGRHTNDLITSFYVKTPSRFMIEYGWGGRNIDVDTWQTFECDYGPSLWGHERSWLTPEKRALARELRVGAARRGYRAPVNVLAGNHVFMEDGDHSSGG